MDFYIIPPNANLELMDEGDRYFCLSQQYLKDANYRKFFKQKVAEGKWVTLDNGAGDHETVTREQVLEIARELQPSELIPLDILFDRSKTIENLVWTLEEMKKDEALKNIEIFACPQGSNMKEWLRCYKFMLNHKDVNTIGMSKLAIPFVVSGSEGGDVGIARDRNFLYSYLKSEDLVKKPLHFLGAGEAWEFEMYLDDPLVRSTDSCFSIWSGMCGELFEQKSFVRIPTPKDYFTRVIEEDQMIDVAKNISYMKQMLKK